MPRPPWDFADAWAFWPLTGTAIWCGFAAAGLTELLSAPESRRTLSRPHDGKLIDAGLFPTYSDLDELMEPEAMDMDRH